MSLDFPLIIQAWCSWFWHSLTGRIPEKAKKRKALCDKCEKSKHGFCTECGCFIRAKVMAKYLEDDNGMSIGGCLLNKW